MPWNPQSVYLASRSPRRRELLAQIGIRFQLLPFRSPPREDLEVSEAVLPNEAPRDYVQRVARAKARFAWRLLVDRKLPPAPVLAADTAVIVDERILGKPADRGDAAAMLNLLSGRSHRVLTSVVLRRADREEEALSESMVRFRPLAAQEILDYLATGEGDDKAGAYAVQGRAAQFIPEIRGSYSGIMGLPVFETAQLLSRLGRPGGQHKIPHQAHSS